MNLQEQECRAASDARERSELLKHARRRGIKRPHQYKTYKLRVLLRNALGKSKAEVAEMEQKRRDTKDARFSDPGHLHFDDYQFQKPQALAEADILKQSEGFSHQDRLGVQVVEPKEARRPGATRDETVWARDPEAVAQFLLTIFPRAFRERLIDGTPDRERWRDFKAYQKAQLWNEVIDLFFAKGCDAGSVARDINLRNRDGFAKKVTPKVVEHVVKQIRRNLLESKG